MDKITYNVEEASRMLNVTPQTVRKYLKNKTIKSVKLGNRFVIPADSITNFLKG